MNAFHLLSTHSQPDQTPLAVATFIAAAIAALSSAANVGVAVWKERRSANRVLPRALLTGRAEADWTQHVLHVWAINNTSTPVAFYRPSILVAKNRKRSIYESTCRFIGEKVASVAPGDFARWECPYLPLLNGLSERDVRVELSAAGARHPIILSATLRLKP